MVGTLFGGAIGTFGGRFLLYENRNPDASAQEVLVGTFVKIPERPKYTSESFGKIGIYPVLLKGADGRNHLIPYLSPPFDLESIYDNLNDGDIISVVIFTNGPYASYPKSIPLAAPRN